MRFFGLKWFGQTSLCGPLINVPKEFDFDFELSGKFDCCAMRPNTFEYSELLKWHYFKKQYRWTHDLEEITNYFTPASHKISFHVF
jgi:hypothetical protein